MKKLKNCCHFFNINRTENFQITNPPQSWVSSFPSVNGNRISVLAIIKKLKNGCHFFNIDRTERFPITDPPKVWVSGFPFMRGHLCLVYESPMCSFTLPDIYTFDGKIHFPKW